MPADALEATHAAEAAARRSYGKLIAFLAARTRDVAGAEDALSEAFAAALADWPMRGVPQTPDAWLLTVARRKLVDAARRRRLDESAAQTLHVLAELATDEHEDRGVPDQRLGLLFACAHPGIDRQVRAPLMLQVVLGFDAATIASAFLVAPTTMGQRLARAKTRIRLAGIGFEVPERAALRERLDAVLEAIYAAYAEGWSDPQGADARRRNLADEAIWLGRLVASLLPDEGEALGLLSLMLHAHARREARRSAAGDYVALGDQDPALWDANMIEEAEALLMQANHCGGSGRYQLEAAVQSAHAVRRRAGRTDWAAIEQLYDALCGLTGSPVAALNRAVAVAHTRGPAAGLAALDALAGDTRLADYQPYWAARAHLLAGRGDIDAAVHAYRQAIGLERDPAVRHFLQQRADAVARGQAHDGADTEDGRWPSYERRAPSPRSRWGSSARGTMEQAKRPSPPRPRSPAMHIACPHCTTTNRVPDERLTEDPVCGRCGQALLPGEPVELSDANFDAVTSKTELPVVVDFWAAWCGPCQTMAPHFAQAARQLKGRALLAKVDSDANPHVSSRLGIRSIPTMVMLRGGREAKRMSGALQSGQIVSWVTQG